MLCPACACELAEDAKFCGCGAAVGITRNPLAEATGSETTPVVAESTASPAATIPCSVAAPPYAIFVMQVMGLALCLSVVTLNTADNLAHGYWRIWIIAVVACAAAVLLMLRLPGAWRKIEAGAGGAEVNSQRVLKISFIFVILFVATAAIVGAEIGKSGSETGQLISDFEEMRQLGSRISKARNAAEHTVPANIEMYKVIEGDVEAFDAVMHRLHAELPVYDDKFPGQHDTTAKSMDSVEVGLKRASLLKQQIVVARDIEGLGPDPRWQAWKDRMQPLLDAEAQLDKD